MRIIYSYPKYGTKEFSTDAEQVIVGRPKPGVVVNLDLTPDGQVSRPHARLTHENGEYWIEDLGSTHGTLVNGRKITAKTRLTPGAEVLMGETTLVVQVEALPPEAPAPCVPEPPPEEVVEGDVGVAVSVMDPLFAPVRAEAADDDPLAQAQRRLTAIYDLSLALGSAGETGPLLQTVVDHLLQAIPCARRGALLLREDEKLLLKAHRPKGEPSVSFTLARQAMEKREAFIWSLEKASEDDEDTPASVFRHRTQAAMYAPLVWKGEPLGVVCVDSDEAGDVFDDDDLRLLMAMANQAAMFVKNHFLQQELQREAAVKANLLRQFSPRIAERLVQQGRPRPGGKRTIVTIMCADVRGFTALAAPMEPDDVVNMLNEMFRAFVPIIFNYDGTVERYGGDSVLAVFGSPEPDDRQWEKAVRAALEMQQAIHELGEEWQNRGLPVFRVGIGIHSGEVIHGFIGSPERMEYTMTGDAVNRTARYCDGADGGELLISKAVYEHVYRLVVVKDCLKIIETKHPETEPNLEAFVVKGLREDAKG